MDNMTIDKNDLIEIGEMCRQIRLRHNLTLQDVATMTDFTKSAISQFEKGKNNNLLLYRFYLKLKESGIDEYQ